MAKRRVGSGKIGPSTVKLLKSPRRGSVQPTGTAPRLAPVVPGEFGDSVERSCRKWLDSIDAAKIFDRSVETGRIESGLLLVVGREAVLKSLCIPEGADRFRFIGALRLLAHRLEREMIDDG